MACPYFMPVEKLEGGNWPHPARLPLGSGWSGHCTAPGHEGEVPSQSVLETSCNLGYACACGWSPPSREWDAVRFAVSAPGVSENPGGLSGRSDVVRLIYVCERDHLPIAKGKLACELRSGVWLSSHQDARVQKMAECFLDTYRKKKVKV